MQEKYEPTRAAAVDAPRRNKWAIPVATLGALAVAAAAILSWVVVPGRKQLPDDTNITRQLSGTAATLLNPQAIASGDLGNAILSGVPVTAERNVKVLATDGSKAEVSDTRSLQTATGQALGKSEATYAVDRKTLEAVKDVPADWKVTPHEGLTVSWPIGAEKKDYTAWINETQATTPVKFVRTEKKADVDTYVYEATSAAAPIKDEQVLAALPKALPQAALAAVVAKLPLPDAMKAQAAQALPSLGDPVPLTYTYEVKSTYWVEPTTGLVIDTKREETRKAVISGPLQAPIYDVDTGFTDASVTAAAKDATDKKNSIETASKTIPMSLLIPGLLALLAGIIGWIMGRRRPEPAPVMATPQARTPDRPADLGDRQVRRPEDGDDDLPRNI